ncbi:MAG: LptA/OstA family protein [Verrucomicrobia bacterium]|nr:LptA/OstA family protein [Verrucomicrobiota bacterium]
MNSTTWQKCWMAVLAGLMFAFSAGAQTNPVALTPTTSPMLPRASESLPPPGAVRLRAPDTTAARRALPLAQSTVVTSDDLVMDMEKKVATFTGHVKVVDAQGTMTADKMIVYLTQQGDSESGVRRIEATGGVVIAQAGSKAIGDEAIYSAVDRTVVLSGAAQVQTDQGIVTGETVIYDMAKGTANVKGRPRLILPGQGGSSKTTLFPASPKPQTQPKPQAAPSQ